MGIRVTTAATIPIERRVEVNAIGTVIRAVQTGVTRIAAMIEIVIALVGIHDVRADVRDIVDAIPIGVSRRVGDRIDSLREPAGAEED